MTHHQAIEASLLRGAAKLVQWTKDGTLVTPEQLAKQWNLGALEVEAAVQRGDVFQVWVNDSPFFPSALIPLGLEQATQVCKALDGTAASSKLIFMQRKHGRLGDRTVVEALSSGFQLSLVCELAGEWKRD